MKEETTTANLQPLCSTTHVSWHPSYEPEDFLLRSFTTCMSFLVATNAFGLGKKAFKIVFDFHYAPNFILFRVNCCQLINYITICGMAVLLITLAVKMFVFDSKLMTQH